MLTITHAHLRNLSPEAYGWLILNLVMPDWRNPQSHDFDPIGDWTKSEVPDDIKIKMLAMPLSSYRDPTGTILLTVGTNGPFFPAQMDGEGWSIEIDDIIGGGWQDVYIGGGARIPWDPTASF